MQSDKQLIVMLALVGTALAVGLVSAQGSLSPQQQLFAPPNTMRQLSIVKRGAMKDEHMHAMHSHLSKKVFDRACAASKDTIDEIINCLTNNEQLLKAVKTETATLCYKEAFGVDFDPSQSMKHKELICNNRDKFEAMTACVYRKTAEVSDAKQMQKLTDVLVDVGLCIINALDG